MKGRGSTHHSLCFCSLISVAGIEATCPLSVFGPRTQAEPAQKKDESGQENETHEGLKDRTP
jgi:hypothetical protein